MTNSPRVFETTPAPVVDRVQGAKMGGQDAHSVESAANLDLPAYTRRRFIGGVLLATASATLARDATAPGPWQIGCYVEGLAPGAAAQLTAEARKARQFVTALVS